MPALRILTPGARSLIVDRGFRGARGQGVPPSGAMDSRALALVNALLGNPPGTAAIEIALIPPTLAAQGGAIRLALSGGLSGTIRTADGTETPVPDWCAFTLAEGATLHLDPPRQGALALIGIGGGPDLPRLLGSHTTQLRAGFGGLNGRLLAPDDTIPCPPAPPGPILTLTPPHPGTGPIRAVPGPQEEWFDTDATSQFFQTGWQVTDQIDRMGMRLSGPPLTFAPGRSADITSDGIAPGAVQVPGNGLPILLLADAQTTGGYAKIATVIRADLPRLAALRPGDTLRFRPVTVTEAETAARAEALAIAAAIDTIRPLTRTPTTTDLLTANIAGAAVDASNPDHFPGHVQGDPPCA